MCGSRTASRPLERPRRWTLPGTLWGRTLSTGLTPGLVIFPCTNRGHRGNSHPDQGHGGAGEAKPHPGDPCSLLLGTWPEWARGGGLILINSLQGWECGVLSADLGLAPGEGSGKREGETGNPRGAAAPPLPGSRQVMQRISRMTEPTSRMERPVMNADTHRGVRSVAGGWSEWYDTLGPRPLPTPASSLLCQPWGPVHCPPHAAPLGCLLVQPNPTPR